MRSKILPSFATKVVRHSGIALLHTRTIYLVLVAALIELRAEMESVCRKLTAAREINEKI